MDALHFIAQLEAAGLAKDLPLRSVDAWVAQRFGVSDRQARHWRLSGRVPQPVLVALRLMEQAARQAPPSAVSR